LATIKSLKPRLFCTALDVVRLNPDVSSSIDISNTDFTDATQPITVDEIEAKILAAKGPIHQNLNIIYASSALRTTPWTGVVAKKYNSSTTGKLWAALAGSNAHTELWKIIFTATKAFTVEGTKSGVQVTGSTGATYTLTGDIQIGTNMWSGTFATGDALYVPIYDTYPELVEISAKLAAAYVLQGIYTQGVPNEQDQSIKYERQAISYLKRLTRPDADDGLSLGGRPSSLALESLAAPYKIDEFGDDKTKYYDEYVTRDDDED
jgi:hypothetical protein